MNNYVRYRRMIKCFYIMLHQNNVGMFLPRSIITDKYKAFYLANKSSLNRLIQWMCDKKQFIKTQLTQNFHPRSQLWKFTKPCPKFMAIQFCNFFNTKGSLSRPDALHLSIASLAASPFVYLCTSSAWHTSSEWMVKIKLKHV